MANKKIKKVPLRSECLMESLQLRNKSIRSLGEDYDFGWSSKSIERGLKDGKVSLELLDALGQYLDVDTDYLSGKYHLYAEKIKTETVVSTLKHGLRAEQFPYLRKQQRTKYDGKFLYERYLEYILIVHDVSMRQFDEMLLENQKSFQLDLEDAIASVLIKHFPQNALGHDIYPDVYKIKNDIDNYNPDELEISENIVFVESNRTDFLEEKYTDLPLIGGTNNENQK
jgi:hypothetical protein